MTVAEVVETVVRLFEASVCLRKLEGMAGMLLRCDRNARDRGSALEPRLRRSASVSFAGSASSVMDGEDDSGGVG